MKRKPWKEESCKIIIERFKGYQVLSISQYCIDKKINDTLKGSVHENRKPYECDSGRDSSFDLKENIEANKAGAVNEDLTYKLCFKVFITIIVSIVHQILPCKICI